MVLICGFFMNFEHYENPENAIKVFRDYEMELDEMGFGDSVERIVDSCKSADKLDIENFE
jgi:hypothetical protein